LVDWLIGSAFEKFERFERFERFEVKGSSSVMGMLQTTKTESNKQKAEEFRKQ
jgi:hypothetical protein